MSVQRRLLSSVIASVVALSMSGACSSDRPPVSGDFFQAQDASFGFNTDSGGQLCEQALVDGGPCGCLESSPRTDPPNHYFGLDRSASLPAGNQRSDPLVAAAVDPTTGSLTPTGEVSRVPTPVCIHFVER